jgi:hypothetical protein
MFSCFYEPAPLVEPPVRASSRHDAGKANLGEAISATDTRLRHRAARLPIPASSQPWVSSTRIAPDTPSERASSVRQESPRPRAQTAAGAPETTAQAAFSTSTRCDRRKQVETTAVTDSPNPYTGRSVPLDFRFHVAMNGVMGIGGDLNRWSEAELARTAELVTVYKRVRPLVQLGEQHRLRPPGTGSSARCSTSPPTAGKSR